MKFRKLSIHHSTDEKTEFVDENGKLLRVVVTSNHIKVLKHGH